MKHAPLYLDFEYRNTQARFIELISVGVAYKEQVSALNLTDPHGKQMLKGFLNSLPPTQLVASYNINAEIRSLFSLYKTEDIPFKNFYCLFREHRCLANKHRGLSAGKVILQGKLVEVGYKAYRAMQYGETCSLLNALWKFLGIFDAAHVDAKNKLRDIMLWEPFHIAAKMPEILAYSKMDVKHLPALHMAIEEEWRVRLERFPELLKSHKKETAFRATHGHIIAKAEQSGYFVDHERLNYICDRKYDLSNEIARFILEKWPDKKTFTWSAKEERYTFHPAVVGGHVTSDPILSHVFPKTDKGAVSLKEETFEKLYPKYDHDPNNYMQQVFAFLRTRNALKNLKFEPSQAKAKSKSLGDFFDPIERVLRPYYNDYGSSTGRTQPKANGYLLLKPVWLRKYLLPPPGHAMLYGDYGKEEILILAVLSKCPALLEAYRSGDPYVHFGTARGMITAPPKTPDWVIQRDIAKQVVLSVFYQMGAKSLALKLRITVAQATILIDRFEMTFPTAVRYMRNAQIKYLRAGFLRTNDGWYMWGDNYNTRSVANHEIQATGWRSDALLPTQNV